MVSQWIKLVAMSVWVVTWVWLAITMLIEVNSDWYTIIGTDESSKTQALITNDPETPRGSKLSKYDIKHSNNNTY